MSQKTFKCGAKPSPRHKLLAARPLRATGLAPAQFAVVPKQLSAWLNDEFGDCVTAEEAFAKAAYSVQNGGAELFVPDAEVKRWAAAHGFLNGAMLTDVMDAMARDGFAVNGQTYTDGPYAGVDFSNESILQSAIAIGTVKIGIDHSALPPTAGNGNGWYATGGSPGQYGNMDHCVCLTGYGSAEYLYGQLGLPVPPAIAGKQGYLLFTWDSIGFVDHAWLMSCCGEAWVRNPTTPGVTPAPTPPPSPAPTPAPTPSFNTLSLSAPLGLFGRTISRTLSGSGSVSGGTAYFTAETAQAGAVNWQAVIAAVEQLLAALAPLFGGNVAAVNWKGLLNLVEKLLPVILPLIVGG